MTCPECGSVITAKRNRCEKCGEDLATYKKMIMLSNRYYNEGLEKAKVRDLSGALLVLGNCLEINKRNTDARNLLGLVYYEMGETVSALSEWVISKHFQPENNDADDYMNALQSNPTRLETLNQTIKKYNSALLSAKQGNEDLAIIQLKKVISLNPHFVKALQLLALLYMKTNEQEKAIKCLTKASKIDVSNTTTLRYLHEIGAMTQTPREESKSNKEVNKSKEVNRNTAEPTIFPMSSYKEDKPNIWAWVNLFLGVIIGVAALYFLVVPTAQNKTASEYKLHEKENAAELSKQTQIASSLEKENKTLKDSVEKLQKQVDGFEVVDDSVYDQLFQAAKLYVTELQKKPNEIDYTKIATELLNVKADTLKKADAVTLYNTIKDATFVKAAETLFDQGHSMYLSRKYDDALTTLTQANEIDPTNVNAIYFMGRTYQQQGDKENAKKYYNELIEKYPDSGRAGEARSRLAEIG